MGAKDILEQKEVLNVDDIMVIFQCKRNNAYKRMREIKSVSDILKVPGRIHKKDYFKYINRSDEEEWN